MSVTFDLNAGDVQDLCELMADVGERSGSIVDDYLRSVGADTIEDNIRDLLPVSGRRWKGKETAAKKAKPFQRQFGAMSVTIKSKKAWNYLYFPDDGSNTQDHYGGQHFMRHGAENARESILEGILGQLAMAIFE